MLNFIWGFGHYFKTNLGVALCALFLGLLGGGMLGYMQSRGGTMMKALTTPVIALLRAFPVFVLMFVLWNFIPRSQTATGADFFSDANAVLILALSAYSISALSDVISDALHFLRQGDTARAWLVIPNIFRIFVILVMSTSIGAAIGVQEVVTYSLIFADGLADRFEKILVLLAVSIFFSTFFAASKWMLDQLTDRLKASKS